VARLIWSQTSKKDLKEIYFYIAQDSKYYANSFVNKINQSVKKLKHFPRIGRVVSEYKNDSIRELIFQNFRIIYQISKTDSINILTIFHTSRDLRKLKLKDWEIS